MPQSQPATCQVVSPREQYKGKQELLYNVGVSAETVGARAIHMQIATIPPGARAKAHKHEAHETAIYALRGESGVWHGDQLEHHSIVSPGDSSATTGILTDTGSLVLDSKSSFDATLNGVLDSADTVTDLILSDVVYRRRAVTTGHAASDAARTGLTR